MRRRREQGENWGVGKQHLLAHFLQGRLSVGGGPAVESPPLSLPPTKFRHIAPRVPRPELFHERAHCMRVPLKLTEGPHSSSDRLDQQECQETARRVLPTPQRS